MNRESFKNLLDQYLTGDLSPDDRDLFIKELNAPENESVLSSILENSFLHDEFEGQDATERTQRLQERIMKEVNIPPLTLPHSRVYFFKRPSTWMAAASIFLLTLFGFLFLKSNFFSTKKEPLTKVEVAKNDILPGRSGAILTLANGEKILLDSLVNQQQAHQAGADLSLHSDQVTYTPSTDAKPVITYNFLEVPRGRQFQVVLSDGTKVWLNAASSLRYPTAFSGNDRAVEVNGEAYFEVAHDESKPFLIKKGDVEVRVLGTHFNINAYDEEDQSYVTLLQGLVEIKKGSQAIKIFPGQQAQIQEKIKVVEGVDTDEVIAWKEGKFQFGETADIKTVMRQISNWYDVDVVYNGSITKHIGGTISRDVKLSQLLKVLETTGAVRFKVEGRTIEVLP